MRREDLQYSFSEALIATEPKRDFRIAHLNSVGEPEELSRAQLFALFEPGDVLAINNTKVECRRVFSGTLEILFLKPTGESEWEVLFPARDHSVGDTLALPGGITATVTRKGLPQTLLLSEPVGEKYFTAFGEPALPPYIQKARGQRHAREADRQWYQAEWAEFVGSAAAPTASLHFSIADLEELKANGVHVAPITLHVGLGTFMPIKVEDLKDHQMHSERVRIPAATLAAITQARQAGRRIWAMGTTALRAVESWAAGDLATADDGGVAGETRLFIRPGFEFKVISGLLTNFHQPESTLLALVMAFAGREPALRLYTWAIDKKFRLFSYGDLTVWKR